MKKAARDPVSRTVNKKSLIKRLSLGIAVVCLAAFLILWDAEILVIPGLVSPSRRQSPAESATQTGEDIVMVDWTAWAQDQIRVMYDVSQLKEPLSLLTTEPYAYGKVSVVRQFYGGEGVLSVYGGLLLIETDGVTRYYLPDSMTVNQLKELTGEEIPEDGTPVLRTDWLTEISSSEEHRLTRRMTDKGNAVFEQTDGSGYIYFDRSTGTMRKYDPPLMWDFTDWENVPSDAGDGSGLTLVRENGLFGYAGSYTDGKNTVSVTIPCQYPAAFPYAEGLAVMTDENGRVTVRDARGEEVLTDLSLRLQDGWRDDDTLCVFSHGLIRVLTEMYNESGVLMRRNEAIVTSAGKTFSLPEGYRAIAYREGIFTITNDTRYGYFSADGVWVGTPSYSYGSPFREGIATVTGDEGKEGLLGRDGKVIFAPAFEEIGTFSGGLAVLRDEAVGFGQVLLWKVKGQYPPPGEEVPEVIERTYYERVPLSRGPKNTFDDGDDIVIVLPELDLPPWVTTVPPTTRPVYTVPVITDNPHVTDPPVTEPVTTEPVPTPPDPTAPDPTTPDPTTPDPTAPEPTQEAPDPTGNTEVGEP